MEDLVMLDLDEQAALERDDRDIEFVAIALCWAGRPSLPEGKVDRYGWWRMQSEIDRRQYIHQARVAVDAWEQCGAN